MATLKMNFRGGIISPGNLYNVLVAATNCKVRYVSIGLRQQLILDVDDFYVKTFLQEMDKLSLHVETIMEQFPNIVSSYPAEEVFLKNNWLSEGVYRDLFDSIDYKPTLKINISDNNQSFTPLLTGNINWVASVQQHYWHLFIRFPKTNKVFEWSMLAYTNDIGRITQHVETIILQHKNYDNINGEILLQEINAATYIIKPAEQKAVLPSFNLPYYEGFNKYFDKNWLGIYRRDELFSVALLKEICELCLKQKIGQICSTPWKSLIIKNIEDKDKHIWNKLLEKYQINIRHAANELNFQVEDHCTEGLQLKQYLIKKLNQNDVRSFGLCIGIKTRRKSEVFSSILVRKRAILKIGKFNLLSVYDILCAKAYNPNERTGFVYSKNNPKFLLAEQLRRSIQDYYNAQQAQQAQQDTEAKNITMPQNIKEKPKHNVNQCKHCFTVYDAILGDTANAIEAGTPFHKLPITYGCPTCDASMDDFVEIAMPVASFV
jgi:rubredoxin